MTKIILDLCGGSGAWSKPYADAGYAVWNITLPYYDVCKWRTYDVHNPDAGNFPYIIASDVYGILAAPPCTMFSFARTTAKTPRDFHEGMKCVRACLEIIWECRSAQNSQLKFWALENPMGYLWQFLGKPAFTFNPCDFEEHYTKKTDLWGYFREPKKTPVELTAEEKARCSVNNRKLPSIRDICRQSDARAITPAGFAKAFFEANK